MYSDELTDFNEEFSFEMEIWRQKLAEQLLVDIKNVEDSFA